MTRAQAFKEIMEIIKFRDCVYPCAMKPEYFEAIEWAIKQNRKKEK